MVMSSYMHGRNDECEESLRRKNLKDRDYRQERKIILKQILKKKDVDCFQASHDRAQWRDLVDTAMNLQIP